MKGYLRSPQKQRERVDRQQDFDVSLYVPFMPVPLSRTHLNQMRTGFPTYMGPSVWFLWHTIAARYAGLEQQCGMDASSAAKILSNIKVMIGYFGLTHPCPYCRYHFTLRVSRNDQHWRELPPSAKNTIRTREGIPVSESNIYPLEYLFLGGPDLEDKLATILDGNSLMLFFYKIHNTVNSSVSLSMTCKSQEQVEEGPFGCKQNENDVIEYHDFGPVFTSSTRNLGRAWPTASRYEFWLKDHDAFTNARQEMEDAHLALNRLDRESGTSLREDFWTYGVDRSSNNVDMQAVMNAIDRLDQAVLNTNLLFTEYALAKAPQCQAFNKSINSFVPLGAPVPLIDGNFPDAPAVCYPAEKITYEGVWS